MGDQAPTKDLSGLEADLKRQIKIIKDDFNENLIMLELAVGIASQQFIGSRVDLVEKTLGKSSGYQLADFFVDLLIATAASPLASIVLSTVIRTFVGRALNTKKVFLKKSGEGVYEIVEPDKLLFGTEFGTPMQLNVTEILKPGNKNYELWRVTESMIEPLSDAQRTAARELIKKPRKPQYTSGTVPSAMFTNAFASFALKERRAHNKIWDEQIYNIDKHEFSEDQLKKHLKSWNQDLTPTEVIDKLRMRYAKIFEALMWVLLFGGYKNMVWVYRPSRNIQGIRIPQVDLWNVDPDLVVYWLNHLPHPLGDGEETFREKEIKEGLRTLGISRPPEAGRFEPNPEQEKERVTGKGFAPGAAYNQYTDPAQVALKKYFKELSVNTEIITKDPAIILQKVR